MEFDQMINQEMQKKTTAQWVEIFERMEDMWFAPVNEYEQVMKDDQILYNRPFIELGESEGRTLRGLGMPIITMAYVRQSVICPRLLASTQTRY